MDPARDDAGLKAEGLDLFRAFGFSYVGYSMTKPPVLPGVGKKTLAKEKVKKSFVLQRKKNGTEVLKGRRGFSRKVSLSQNAMKYQRELVYQ